MLFNSIDFAIFLPVVFFIYWFLLHKQHNWQNLFMVAASYVFYGWWDWRFLSLILFSTLIDYLCGRGLASEENPLRRKLYLLASIVINLGFLGFFKYYNFFLDNFRTAFTFFGQDISLRGLNIILPVGISFYTFQTLSYTIDVYRRKLEPTSDFIAFAAYVSFFPQLVAGPIERATNLLPQFYHNRIFDYNQAVDGMRQILWGLFKKIVIADNCARYANLIFNNSGDYGGSTLLLGVLFFTFQIYGDFSGYSDIAIGTSRLFGFNLMRNFAFPYFSRDIAEFWRRWHISLSTWFRDYLYIPLGGSRNGKAAGIRNTFIIFAISGFWHGANWTFIVWGLLNALYFLPLLLLNRNRQNLDTIAAGKLWPSLREFSSMALTFGLTVFAWIFFRAANLTQAGQIISEIFSASFFTAPALLSDGKVLITIILVIAFVIMEWLGREEEYAMARIGFGWPRYRRWAMYYAVILVSLYFAGEPQQFIYFQF
jgi:D-alanyl-lipoteichoic acid acyltransferase DltB (MBOAT superfamily)